MKMPALRLGREGFADLLLRHGEKLAGGIVGLVIAALLWRAVSAVRFQSVQRTETPDVITQEVTQAEASVTRVRDIPADQLPTRVALAERIEPWRGSTPEQLAAVDLPEFDRPLTEEMSRRDRPTAFTIEDLRTVAGVAVVPDDRPVVPNPRRPADRGLRPGMMSPDGMSPDGMSPDGMMMGAAMATKVKATPYVVITGLVPMTKQVAEFRRCFAAAQYQDPQRDWPRWSSFKVERAVVGPGGLGRWENVPITGPRRPGGVMGGGMPGMGGDMSGMGGMGGGMMTASDGLPASFLLAAAEIPYATPLPQRLDEPWGAESLHPWFAEQLRKALDEGVFDELPPEEIPVVALADLKKTPERFFGKTIRITNLVLEPKPTRVREAGVFSYTVKSDTGEKAGNPKLGTTRDLAITTTEQFGNFLNLGGDEGGGGEAGRGCNLVVRIEAVGRTPVARVQEIEFLDATGEVIETEVEMAGGLLSRFDTGMGEDYGMGAMAGGMGGMAGGMGGMPPGFGGMAGGMGGGFAGMAGGFAGMAGGYGGMGGGFAAGPGMEDDGSGMGGMGGMMQNSRRPGLEYRLFRFIDTTVQPGRTYRYRITVALRNPNFDLPGQYLGSVDFARGQFLLSTPSEPSPAVQVPETTAVLAGFLMPDDVKRLKVRPGMQEVLVLAPQPDSGRYLLRGVLVEKGGVADIDASLNRGTNVRSRGEDIATGRVLVDVFGQQLDRSGGRRNQITEPLDMLFLKPDGGFEVVSAAESERPIAKYRGTLEGEVRRDPAMFEMESDGGPESPFQRPGRPR
jgi:hypothetical protein